MPVKGVDLTSIDARRFAKKGERMVNVRIDNNSTVTLISEINEKEVNVDFRYTASYGSLGLIKIEGTIVYEGEASSIANKWGQSGNMPDEIASEIHTAIMRTCVPEAVLISRDLKLPPPMPMPQVNISKKKSKKQSSGMEVA